MQDHSDRLEEAMEQLEFVYYEHWTWDEEQQQFIWYGSRSLPYLGKRNYSPTSWLAQFHSGMVRRGYTGHTHADRQYRYWLVNTELKRELGVIDPPPLDMVRDGKIYEHTEFMNLLANIWKKESRRESR